jgi:hypothetical protein
MRRGIFLGLLTHSRTGESFWLEYFLSPSPLEWDWIGYLP